MGNQTEITTTAERKLCVVMLSKKRVAWFVSVQLIRLAIACLLGAGMRVIFKYACTQILNHMCRRSLLSRAYHQS